MFRFVPVLVLSFFLLVACSKDKTKDPVPFKDEALSGQLATYRTLIHTQEDSHGALLEDACDSALWTALGHPVDPVDIWSFYDADKGQWYRSPSHDCYDTRGSASDLSADMALGLMWYSYLHGEPKIASTLWDYASGHGWHLGRGPDGVSTLDLYMQATLAALIHKQGGTDHNIRQTPVRWKVPGVPTPVGFRAHFEVLEILLRERILDTIESTAHQALKDQASRSSHNPLFAYAAGDTQKAVALLKTPYFPVDRLPTSSDRCEQWLFQRDEGSDWSPCDEGKTHSGGDFIFLATLILDGK